MELVKDFRSWGDAMAYYKRIKADKIQKGGKGWIVVKYKD